MSINCSCGQTPCTCSACTTDSCATYTPQILTIDNAFADLSILPDGNTVNLCDSIHLCETKTRITGVRLVDTLLEITYLGEDSVPQVVSADLADLVENAIEDLPVQNTSTVDLTVVGGVLQADVNIDPASTVPVTASAQGLRFDCCPQTPLTVVSTQTLQLNSSGVDGHQLTGNVRIQSSPSITLFSTGTGISGSVNYSNDLDNASFAGTDGGLYVQTACSQLGSLPLGGFVTTGSSGTYIVGSDCHLYQVPTPNVSCSAISSLFAPVADRENPLISVYGKRNDGSCGSVAFSFDQYGPYINQYTDGEIAAFPSGDLRDVMFIFNTTVRAFQWFDQLNSIWVTMT